ncbi:MAG: hypothetical protein GF334_04935 [Candidatus Altiarchaeales archaeon]|nr:hypothetical protein [Candidatus Altiarchaeales archaeon]
MSMEKEDVEQRVEEALSCPVLARRIRSVVEDIEENVPGDKSKQMMYDLVDIVLQMGQRVRALEKMVVHSGVREELVKKENRVPSRFIDYGQDFPNERERAYHR